MLIIQLQLMTPALFRQVPHAPEQLQVWDLREKCSTCQLPWINACGFFFFKTETTWLQDTQHNENNSDKVEREEKSLMFSWPSNYQKRFSKDLLISTPADWLHGLAALEMQPKLQRTLGKKMTRKYTAVRQIKTPTHQHWPLNQTLESIKFLHIHHIPFWIPRLKWCDFFYYLSL